MKILKEYTDGFRWIDGDTSSAPFEKDSELYNEKLVEGFELELIPQSEKEAHEQEQAKDKLKQELASLDVPLYTVARALTGDKEAIDKLSQAEAKKKKVRAKLSKLK